MSILWIVIRLCSRCAAKTELCVTVITLKLWFLSIPKSSRHIHELRMLSGLTGLAVDLGEADRESRIVIRESRSGFCPVHDVTN